MVGKQIYGDFDRIDITKKHKSILKKLGIQNIETFINSSENAIFDQLFAKGLLAYEEDVLSYFKHIKKEVFYSEKEFRNRDGFLCHDMKIEYLSLSTRAFHYLKNKDIHYISEIIDLDDDFEGLGGTTISEILDLKKRLSSMLEDRINVQTNYDGVSVKCLTFIKQVRKIMDIHGDILFDTIYEVWKQEMDLFEVDLFGDEMLYIKLSRNDCIKRILKELALHIIKGNEQKVTVEQLTLHMPMKFNTPTIVYEILKSLEEDELLYVEDDLYRMQYSSIYEFINGLENEIHKNILLRRLQGITLEQIGIELGLMRERVRQIILRAFRDRPLVSEDKYVAAFTNYFFEKEQFKTAFGTEDYVYYYLKSCYKKGNKAIDESYEDERLSKREIKCMERAIYKNYFFIGTTYVKKHRSDLCEYVIKTYATNDMEYVDFVKKYYEIVEDLGLKNDEQYSIKGRGYENKLTACDYILWKYGKKLRYYNMKAYDFNEFITTLNLHKYKDLEISTLLLFRNHQDLMNTYDIRDEYELHNLLKKIIKDADLEITFHRMPNIEIGYANREKQVMDMLIVNAPIENVELAKLYEEEYGVGMKTVLANYFKEIAIYFHDGIYKIDYPIPPEDILKSFKEVLVNDFYMLKEAKELLVNELSLTNLDFINAYVFKTVGYKVYSSYIIKDTYESASAYFRMLLTKHDLVNIKEIPTDIVNLGAFQSELGYLRARREIVEYLPSKYISSKRLFNNGITSDMLNEFCELVSSNIKEGEYFTVHSILEDRIQNKLIDLKFDEVFYASILVECKTKFQYRRMGGNKLFLKGSKAINYADFLAYVIEKEELVNIDTQALMDLLKEHYHIVTEKHKIIEFVKGTTMFYDEIYNRVYLNSSTYYNEV